MDQSLSSYFIDTSFPAPTTSPLTGSASPRVSQKAFKINPSIALEKSTHGSDHFSSLFNPLSPSAGRLSVDRLPPGLQSIRCECSGPPDAIRLEVGIQSFTFKQSCAARRHGVGNQSVLDPMWHRRNIYSNVQFVNLQTGRAAWRASPVHSHEEDFHTSCRRGRRGATAEQAKTIKINSVRGKGK